MSRKLTATFVFCLDDSPVAPLINAPKPAGNPEPGFFLAVARNVVFQATVV